MSDKKTKDFRSTLGRVRSLGAAKSGTHDWYLMRLTSLALIVLSVYPLIGLLLYAVYGGRAGALAWLHSPFAATGIILFLIIGFHHTAHGLQVVIEDYIHCPVTKPILIFAVKFGSAVFAILGSLATLKIALGV